MRGSDSFTECLFTLRKLEDFVPADPPLLVHRPGHGLIANAMVTTADGFAEREAAKAMMNDARQRVVPLSASGWFDQPGRLI